MYIYVTNPITATASDKSESFKISFDIPVKEPSAATICTCCNPALSNALRSTYNYINNRLITSN